MFRFVHELVDCLLVLISPKRQIYTATLKKRQFFNLKWFSLCRYCVFYVKLLKVYDLNVYSYS